MKSPSRAGALARTASTGSDGRDDVVAQDVLELDRLGGRRDVVGRQLARIAYWSRMWLSWPSSRVSSSSVSPRRAR